MVRKTTPLLALALLIAPAFAELTVEQKLLDFQQMAAVFAKQYGPYDWKVRTFGFDLLDLRPWLDRVRRTKSDLEFIDLIYEYTASLHDGHVTPFIPSNFQAYLGFTVDLYDGRFLIDQISRRQLPQARYPFVIGDELVSLDGITVEEWVTRLTRYSEAGNPRATRRYAADYITFRVQAINPFAGRIPEQSKVVIRRQNGDLETYDITWSKFGTAIEDFGKVPNPRTASRPIRAGGEDDIWNAPSYMQPLLRWQQLRLERAPYQAVRGVGDPAPYYNLPAGFQVRLGRSAADFFVSGTFQGNGLRLGYLRVPDFDSSTAKLQQFVNEIAFFEANTDGLVIDETRNPGGNGCFAEAMLRYLVTTRFTSIGFQLRASAALFQYFDFLVERARALNADQAVISQYEAYRDAMRKALGENRGVTTALPLCGASLELDPVTDRTGRFVGYSKPIVLLVDEMAGSAADMFAAVLQDTDRATLFGLRTMGLGGNLNAAGAALTTYTEVDSGVTLGMMVRSRSVVTSEFPTVPFVENVGVRPHAYYDFMTRDNLLQQGQPFVRAWTQAIVQAIRPGE